MALAMVPVLIPTATVIGASAMMREPPAVMLVTLLLVVVVPPTTIVAVRGAGERAQEKLVLKAAWQVLRPLLLHQRKGAAKV